MLLKLKREKKCSFLCEDEGKKEEKGSVGERESDG
mgnify:CR=1 FL=1